MKQKLMGIAILSALILSCTTGCGEEKVTPDNIEDTINSMTDEELESAIIENAEKLEGNESSESVDTIPTEITATDEIISAEKYDGKIQIGSKVYTFPITVSEFLASGELSLAGDAKETSLVDAGETYNVNVKGNGVDLSFKATNTTDSIAELKSCVIEKGSVGGIDEQNTNVFLSGGIHAGMNYNDFIEIFGEPDYKDENIYKYYDDFYKDKNMGFMNDYGSATGYGYTVCVDMDNACIASIGYSEGERSTELKKITDCNNGKFPVLYSVPSDFEDGITVMDIDGVEYLLNSFSIRSVNDNSYPYEEEFPQVYTEEAFKAIIPDAHYYEVIDEDTAIIVKRSDEFNGTSTYVIGDSWLVTFYDNNCFLDSWKLTVSELNRNNTEPVPEEAMNQALEYILTICRTMSIENNN